MGCLLELGDFCDYALHVTSSDSSSRALKLVLSWVIAHACNHAPPDDEGIMRAMMHDEEFARIVLRITTVSCGDVLVTLDYAELPALCAAAFARAAAHR